MPQEARFIGYVLPAMADPAPRESPSPPAGSPPIPEDDWTQGKKTKYNYHHLAELMGKQPGFAIVRRFATLNAKNLLYMQAELANLELELEEAEQGDLNSPDFEHRKFQWEASRLAGAAPGEDQQWQKVLEIRAKLKEYNCLLLEQQRLHALPGPNAHDLSKLREILNWEEYGNEWLEWPEDAWSPRYDDDLVALSVRASGQDRFDRYISETLVPFVHHHVLHRQLRPGEAPDKTYEYSEKALLRGAEVFMIIVAALLPSVPIIVLNAIPEVLPRLAFTVAFSFVFSIFLAYCTSARRPEIFAVVTALASVQVVFIGTIA